MQYINYRENRRRGTADFPLEYYHVTASHPQYVMSFHWHVEFELIRILSGSLTVTIDEIEFLAEAGDSIFIPAGSIHSGIPADCVYECLVFDMNMLMNRTLWTLFDAAASKKEGYQLVVFGAMYQFFGTLFSEGFCKNAPDEEHRSHKRILQLKQALEFMESSYNLPLTLEEISGSVNMSPKYFCRFFHEMTHRTPIDYLNYYRIERACYQLITTDLSITEIAYASGFNDLSYFIKTFKKYKGTTPKKYLKI